MDTDVTVALLTALGSLAIAIISAGLTWRQDKASRQLQLETETKLKEFEDELQARAALRDARLEYEYEALKDLYRSAEPLLFQLHELCQQMFYRVLSLARSARNGNLDEGKDNWLDGAGYYMKSTIYSLLAPSAAFRLLQRRVTFIDIGLDASIGERYYIARAIYSMLSEHHELALNFEPKLDYHPNNAQWEALRVAQPEIYWRQGIPGQILDAASEALLAREADGTTRLKTYHEFSLEFDDDIRTDGVFGVFYDVFLNFHPRSRPVLWRILVVQAHLCELFVKSRAKSDHTPWANIGDFDLSSNKVRIDFDWRKPAEKVSEQEALDAPFAVSAAYLRARVPFALRQVA